MNRHRVTNTWTTAAMQCVSCGESWEQPSFEEGATWVCPHCLHAAKAWASTTPVALPDSIWNFEDGSS